MSNEAAMHGHPEVITTHEAHHGEHHVHHHKETFITKYVFSMDHKMIAKQFLITGMVWAIIGGLMSVLFRLQLGYPDQSFPILEDILGRWAKDGKITAESYYALVTMHGTVLVFFVLTGGLSGTFANFLIPLQVGARDMASPFLNMLSYWFFFIASIVMVSSLFVQTGPFAGGWTAYPPLSALGDASPGSKIGMDLWITAMALFVVSSLLGGLNYISTILNMRTKGMSMTRLPLTIWALFFTAVLEYFLSLYYYQDLFFCYSTDMVAPASIYQIFTWRAHQLHCLMKVEVQFFTSTCSGSLVTPKYISLFFLRWVSFLK